MISNPNQSSFWAAVRQLRDTSKAVEPPQACLWPLCASGRAHGGEGRLVPCLGASGDSPSGRQSMAGPPGQVSTAPGRHLGMRS